jgi:hypothetical protein
MKRCYPRENVLGTITSLELQGCMVHITYP